MKLKINLYGNAFLHNIVEGKISSTDNQTPQYVEFVTDGSGEINLFVDSGLFEIEQLHSSKPNYGWMLESKSIRPDIFEYFSKENIKVSSFSSFNLDSDLEIGKVDPNYLLEILTKMDTGDADALFISCTALPALKIIDQIETKINKTVLSSNQTLIWDSIRSVGYTK